MKKFLLIVLVCVLAFTMFACTKKEEASTVSDFTQHNTDNLHDANDKVVGTVQFENIGGEGAELYGYVGIHEEHSIKLGDKIGDSGYTVAGIGNSAFLYCTTLKSITLPNTLTYIGEFAFAGCTGLESITIPASVTSIGKGAFNGCTSLKEIKFEGTELEIIDSYAFASCTALEKINFPEGLKTIGEFAFYNCEKITSFKAPSTLKKVGNLAFEGCKGLNAQGAVDFSVATAFETIDDIARFAFATIDSEYVIVPEDQNSIAYKYFKTDWEAELAPQE